MRCALVLALALLLPSSLVAQVAGISEDSSVVVAGQHYDVAGVVRFFWGDHYRGAWTTPLTVPVLNLEEFADGLTPLRRGGGRQTKSLVFAAGDGKRYAFRSVDKDPTAALPPEFRQTIAEKVLQDQVSSQHPVAPLLTDPIERAAGVLHVEPVLYVMPDDSALGEFREEFAGMLGMMVERPGDHVDERAIFAGAVEVIDGQVIFDRIQASPRDRIDSSAFLAARLIDILVGDWDRHRYQWRWACFDCGPVNYWVPIAEDRDQAFSKLDGLFPSQAWRFIPELVGFKAEYPNIIGLHFTAQEIDRRFLTDLERPVWDSVAADLSRRVTDQVIDEAMTQLPPDMFELDGDAIGSAMKQRRDKLPNAATDLYELLAEIVEIQATDAAEEIQINEVDGQRVEVLIADAATPSQPYYSRRFDPGETDQIRIRMHGGDDLAVVRGGSDLAIAIRVIGGEGDDELRYETPTRSVSFYDQFGRNHVSGDPPGRRKINRRSYAEWMFSPGRERPPREWGSQIRPIVEVGVSTDYGVLAGGGVDRWTYAFRKHPHSSRVSVAGGITTTARFIVEAEGDWRQENTTRYYTLSTYFSNVGVINFFGFGNDTESFGSSDFFKVRRREFAFDPGLGLSVGKDGEISLGAALSFSHTEENTNFISTIPDLYGTGDVWQIGAYLGALFDTRDFSSAATRGVMLDLKGSIYPELFDIVSPFGTLNAVATTYLTPTFARSFTLALRAGGRKLWGDFPYYESAFVGGIHSLRGWDAERFAGDASLYGSAELRIFLTQTRLLSIGDLGVFGLADAGRVYVDGNSPGGWHTGYGGGLWFSFLGRQNSVSAGVARSDEGTRVYIAYGFAF